MDKLYEVALRGVPQFNNLTPSVQEFFKKYFELWIQKDGCKQSNQYFAERENVGITSIEKRFKALRTARVLKTDLNHFHDPGYNQAGFATVRTIKLDPLFEAKLKVQVIKIKEAIKVRQSITGVVKSHD